MYPIYTTHCPLYPPYFLYVPLLTIYPQYTEPLKHYTPYIYTPNIPKHVVMPCCLGIFDHIIHRLTLFNHGQCGDDRPCEHGSKAIDYDNGSWKRGSCLLWIQTGSRELMLGIDCLWPHNVPFATTQILRLRRQIHPMTTTF